MGGRVRAVAEVPLKPWASHPLSHPVATVPVMGKDNRARHRAKQVKRGRKSTLSDPSAPFTVAPGYFDDAFRLLARMWPAQDARSSALVGEMARPGCSPAAEDAVAACLASARASLLSRGWRLDEAARVSRKSKDLDADARALILGALESACVPRVVWPLEPLERRRRVLVAVAALAFLFDLPRLPDLLEPARRTADPEQARMLEKVRALLAKAESTEYDEEAQALTAKAQELMARHAIDEAMVDAGSRVSLEAKMDRIGVDNPYAGPKALLLQHIAAENRCRAMWDEAFGFSTVFGSEGDLRVVDLLYTSLLVQAVASMRRSGADVDAAGRSRTRSFRQSFLVAFAARIAERLREANHAAQARAIEEVGPSFLPVLVSRADAADRACDEMFPGSTAKGVSSWNAAGHRAGRAAADIAHIEAGPALRSNRSA